MLRHRVLLLSLLSLYLFACSAFGALQIAKRSTPTPTPLPPTRTSTLTPTLTPTTIAATQTPTSSADVQVRTGTPASLPSVNIGLLGSAGFVSQTDRALAFLAACASADLETADEFINVIEESDRSGMLVDQGVFLASQITAFAPGYSEAAQVFWYAGSIVHDAHHRWQAQQGMSTDWDALSLEQREALESDARGVQIAVLEICGGTLPAATEGEWTFMLKYLTDMQKGITPCDYCDTEWGNRNW